MRGRFAPSPTGALHLGNVRTALLAWLQARSAGGQFVLRMEDLDPQRSSPQRAAQILQDLRWLGLDWDEGPDTGGPYAPYEQSRRSEFYRTALQRLSDRGLAYRCYCSRAEVAAAALAPNRPSDDGPRYPGTCRHLTPAQEAAHRARGRRPSWRFRVPPGSVSFDDAVSGPQRYDVDAGVGDFILWRSDDVPAYQLAVVVDDAAMRITDVLRGDDLLDSTPRQILIYRSLGLPVPRFAHVPLLLGPDGKRLSKRHGAVSIESLRAMGVAPERIVGYLAAHSGLLDRAEPCRPRDLIAFFSPQRVPRRPLVVDPAAFAGPAGDISTRRVF